MGQSQPKQMKFKLQHCGNAIQFHPFSPDKVAVATADNFGFVGKGWQSVLHVRHIQAEKLEYGAKFADFLTDGTAYCREDKMVLRKSGERAQIKE